MQKWRVVCETEIFAKPDSESRQRFELATGAEAPSTIRQSINVAIDVAAASKGKAQKCVENSFERAGQRRFTIHSVESIGVFQDGAQDSVLPIKVSNRRSFMVCNAKR